ncbi:outer membrane protein OmpA-like peptidoglycan-associated protein [Rhizobium wenxiniae]|uniref:Outer membrane protein OmpA-like peptidoglycan-associated protein n=2 Tax=Rhizobium wenxiniae TaxID=1737357 RepID=A0A7W9Y1W0_9HYPH|nr:OmpA family protein [Rhizobium wenxiniae]MBB6160474.1 outer membrane protein OmpA-like peptidoglycan-associated protein [Rhizobium wenxiniae]
MSMKSRLFASVAAPVLSLPLLMQPAYALPSGADLGSVQPAAPGIIRVQEQVPADGEELPKRRKPQADQGEGAERPRGERQQRAEQPEGERPQRRQQQADQGEGGGERPQPRQREQRAEQPDAERPQRREQQADQGEGSERPQRRQQNAEQAPDLREQAKPDADQAEQPKPRKERQQQAEQPQVERPQRQQAEQGDVIQPPKPRAQQNADQAPEPKPSAKPPAKADAQQAEQPKPRQERQQQAEQPQAEQPQGRPQQAERPQAERPQRQQADQGDVIQPPKPRSQQNADQAPVPQQQPGQPPKPARQQAQDADKAPDQAVSGGERNQPRPVEQTAEQPRLPVENGAAVLDSAKEQRPDRAQRGGDRPQDPSRPDRRGTPLAPDQQQAQERAAPPPRNDADAQVNDRVTREDRERWRNQRRELVEERGQRIDGRPDFERPRGWDVLGPIGDALLGQNQNQDRNRDRGRDRNWDRDRDDGRVMISIDNQTYVRHDDSRRFYDDGGRPEYERLGDGRYREVVERSDGTRVVTIRNRYGEVVQRSRIVRGGREYVLYYAPELLEDRQDYTWRDPGDDLPPMRLGVPIDDYIIDTSSEPDRDYYRFLEQPPVERVERPYSLDEVRYSARIRDKVPRIDLDTITFATGSAEIPMNQATSLRKVADAINKVLEKDPSETFLIEGHTDAVGSDESNLVLSDRRAESVAVVLSDAFGIPPENMTTQGYGERYLKVNTEAANQENRRVTIRRITPLVKPVASNQ